MAGGAHGRGAAARGAARRGRLAPVPEPGEGPGGAGDHRLRDTGDGDLHRRTRPHPHPDPSAPPDREIPAGWKLHEDPLGFSVAVPRGWTVRRFAGRDRVEFREPGSDRFLWIESTDDPEKDPVRHWEKVEEGGRAKNVWPGYERVAITSLTYLDRPAADWEFTFLRDEVPTHVLDRGFRTGEGTPYAIYWETPEDSWDRTFFDRFTETFRP
nr:hypothetical protein GCM10020093_115400 [Planobispora longispora]